LQTYLFKIILSDEEERWEMKRSDGKMKRNNEKMKRSDGR
jgi:hypothetical protein